MTQNRITQLTKRIAHIRELDPTCFAVIPAERLQYALSATYRFTVRNIGSAIEQVYNMECALFDLLYARSLGRQVSCMRELADVVIDTAVSEGRYIMVPIDDDPLAIGGLMRHIAACQWRRFSPGAAEVGLVSVAALAATIITSLIEDIVETPCRGADEEMRVCKIKEEVYIPLRSFADDLQDIFCAVSER